MTNNRYITHDEWLKTQGLKMANDLREAIMEEKSQQAARAANDDSKLLTSPIDRE